MNGWKKAAVFLFAVAWLFYFFVEGAIGGLGFWGSLFASVAALMIGVGVDQDRKKKKEKEKERRDRELRVVKEAPI